MGMKLKSGADLCGFELTNFCIQGLESMPSDAALGRKYFHTNATDDVATGISLLNRERIYLGEGAWRATAYLDDIAAINEKLNLITGDTDTDTLINNLKDLEEFLKDFSETDKLKSLLDGKLDKSGGTISGNIGALKILRTNQYACAITFQNTKNGAVQDLGGLGFDDAGNASAFSADYSNSYTLIHSGNIGSQKVAGLATPVTIWGQSFDGTRDIANGTNGTMRRLLFHDTFNDSGTSGYIGRASSSNNDVCVNSTYNLRLMSGGNYTMWLNSSGNVTIGASDLAGTSYKAYINGSTMVYAYATSPTLGNKANNSLVVGTANYGIQSWIISTGVGFIQNSRLNGTAEAFDLGLQPLGGNVLIGTTTDSGYKLDVYGGDIRSHISEALPRNIIVSNRNAALGIRVAAAGDRGLYDATTSNWMLYTNGTNIFIPDEVGDVIIGDRSELKSGAKLQVKGDLYVDGNIISTKEVSAGGAGAEEGTSGSGSAEGVSEVFTPTSTSMAFDHNLGEDVIVQVYEKSGNVWNMVIVDTEITSATRVTLRFGKTETTQHKVVIMGV